VDFLVITSVMEVLKNFLIVSSAPLDSPSEVEADSAEDVADVEAAGDLDLRFRVLSFFVSSLLNDDTGSSLDRDCR
jgi:hypothetical protein